MLLPLTDAVGPATWPCTVAPAWVAIRAALWHLVVAHRTQGGIMYIGGGAVLLILIIVVVVLAMRR